MELANGGKVFALGPYQTLVLSAKGEGSLSFYAGTKESEDWVAASGIDFKDKDEVSAWFRERFADWRPDREEIFATDDSYFAPRPQCYFPLDQSWTTLPNLTMPGDAAHRMPLFFGRRR